MFNIFKLFSNITWIKNTIVKISLGITSSKLVINYIMDQLKGTDNAVKITPYLLNILDLLTHIEQVLNIIIKVLTGNTIETISQKHVMSVIDANKNIQKISKELASSSIK